MLLGTGGPTVEELTGYWTKLHNESIHGFDSPLNLTFYVPHVMIVTSRSTHFVRITAVFQTEGCLPQNTFQPTHCATYCALTQPSTGNRTLTNLRQFIYVLQMIKRSNDYFMLL